ncbi:hypothetical protein WJR50_30825 [Catalinimonas sp. 4WD22]
MIKFFSVLEPGKYYLLIEIIKPYPVISNPYAVGMGTAFQLFYVFDLS